MMVLIFCFHEKPKCSHQDPNLPVVCTMQWRFGWLNFSPCVRTAHLIMRTIYCIRSLQHILNFRLLFDYYYYDGYYCCPGVSLSGYCICIGRKNNERINRRRHSLAWCALYTYRQLSHSGRNIYRKNSLVDISIRREQLDSAFRFLFECLVTMLCVVSIFFVNVSTGATQL